MTPRQEPVLNTGVAPVLKLTDRIGLSWAELLDLAHPSHEKASPAEVSSCADTMPRPFELELTEEEKKAIAARLAPLVERAVREGLRDAIDFSLSNAVSRMKGDLERSVSALVTRAVDREVQNLHLSDFVKR